MPCIWIMLALLTAQTPAPGDLPLVDVVRAFPSLSFQRPVGLVNAGDGSNRLFVIEQDGLIRVFANDRRVEGARVFLNISEKVRRRHNEEGLLGLAFHPRFKENGYFYVCYSATPRRDVLSRFSVSSSEPDRADPASEQVILELEQPYGNHNGATVVFGPDGMLYVSFGDGGLAGDPLRAGQDLSTLLAKIIRIDVDHPADGRPYSIPKDNPFVSRPGARGEIWAYGLRNVWRMSFDRATGELWAGDVGQNAWEEIDLIVKGGNYGWYLREGAHPYAREQTEPVDPFIDPVIEYPQKQDGEMIGLSVTGGCVYRGPTLPRLVGAYVYADYVSGRIWALRHEKGSVRSHREIFPPRRGGFFVTSFGEDESGELFLCVFDHADGNPAPTGRIYRLVER